MKWILLVSLGWLHACGQQPSNSENMNAANYPDEFNSKYVRLVPDTTRMMLIENVVIDYGDLYVEADSALLDKLNQSVTAFGIKKLRFKERDVKKTEYKDRIKYKKGDPRFYTE